ncbi:MAG: ASCH domain-containing protein [Bacilli bacterium]|nr:ASCH domain-containing protein [Bacilli bacterium]
MKSAERIVISINPEHVENILNGRKKYEYRTKAAKKDVKKIIIYETSPIKKIVAEAEIVEVLELPPEELWDQTKDKSGITKNFFDQYFEGREIAYAYKLGKVTKYKEVKNLVDFGIKAAPQSFVYVY